MKKAILSTLIMALALLGITACARKGDNTQAAKTFVLVHGAWQAPYVWQNVKTQLEAKGQNVLVVELPAHGGDYTSPLMVSINVYRDKVIDAMKGIQGKVILVGHSMGGVVVSAVAEKIPGQIEKLIYIGAFVPANGQSLMDLAMMDKQSQLGASLIPSQDQLTLNVKTDQIINIFCQDADAATQSLVLQKFRVEPAIPFADKAVLTDANFGKVDKYYVHTTLDHAVGPDLQNTMIAGAHITKVYSLNTGHSPFLSKPDDVSNLLLSISK